MEKNAIPSDGLLGQILLHSEKITEAEIATIVEYQKKSGLLFGDAARKLELASQEDVDMAIAYQFSHPYLEKNHNGISAEIIAAYSPFEHKVEAIRNVRTSMLLAGAGEDLKTICFVDCQEGDGQVFVATNLAVVFAQMEHKTLLVDFDLRKPKVHKLFKLKNSSGVSTLLINRSSLDDSIRKTPFEKLDVLPSGPLPPNPLSLIARKETGQRLDELKQCYDVIIVTTPSFSSGADASYLSTLMDGVVIVALKEKTRKDDLVKAKRLIEGGGAQILGTVLNEL